MIESFFKDLRQSLRMFWQSRAFTAAAVGGPFHGGGSWVTISPGYFDVFKIPVKRGRAFTDRDTQQAPGVVIINETMARRFWEKGDPLNERLVIGRGGMREFASEPERQIIGVVATCAMAASTTNRVR